MKWLRENQGYIAVTTGMLFLPAVFVVTYFFADAIPAPQTPCVAQQDTAQSHAWDW